MTVSVKTVLRLF